MSVQFIVGCLVLVVLYRLDQLSRQVEAVCVSIKAQLAPDPDGEREILREWKDSQAQAAKERRQAWWGVGIIGALWLAWTIFSNG
jgi:hypothetical protein